MRRRIHPPDTPSAASEAEQQAATWFVRQQDNTGERDAAAFERWLAQDAAHRVAYARIAEAWRTLDALPAHDVARLKAGGPRAAPWPGRRTFVPRFALAGAALAMAGGGALGWRWLHEAWLDTPTFAQRYDTRRGEFQTVSLPDASTMQLDTDTHVQARFFPRRREVQVHRGQAMFAVQSDPRAPFHVFARDVTVTVVGTRFAVRCTNTGLEQGNVRVDVEEGRVRVASAAQPGIELTAGQSVATDDRGRLERIASIAPADVGAWREGRVRFDDTTLARALQEFERYLPTGVAIHDPAVAAMHVTGSFDVRQAASFVRALPRVLPVRIRQRGDVTEIVPAA
ncbi:FecR family protein [Burkholderia perseverans]|uniref:FecR family protein n=1 Tax=Burkholderia perseverans TaxID=2615214 RepID=UPI001FEDC0ED|nr:FecR domain-containing protein [Burkholderia perseverans]